MPVSNANTKGTHSGTESTENTMRYAHNLGSTARRKHRLEASAATSTSARASSVGKLELTWYSQLRWTKASFSLNHPQEVRELGCSGLELRLLHCQGQQKCCQRKCCISKSSLAGAVTSLTLDREAPRRWDVAAYPTRWWRCGACTLTVSAVISGLPAFQPLG